MELERGSLVEDHQEISHIAGKEALRKTSLIGDALSKRSPALVGGVILMKKGSGDLEEKKENSQERGMF